MAEYVTHAEENGSIHIAEDVVAAIVTDAVKEIEGVGAMSQNVTEQLTGKKAARGVRVEQVDDAFCDAVDGTAGPEDDDPEEDEYWNDV